MKLIPRDVGWLYISGTMIVLLLIAITIATPIDTFKAGTYVGSLFGVALAFVAYGCGLLDFVDKQFKKKEAWKK